MGISSIIGVFLVNLKTDVIDDPFIRTQRRG